MAASRVYTAKEYGDIIGVSREVIYDLVRQGEIPNVGHSRTVRIPRVWVEQRFEAAINAHCNCAADRRKASTVS